MLTAKTAFGVSASVMVLTAAAMQEAGAQIPMPENLWPDTVAGWVALFLSFASAVGVIYAVHRASLQPILERLNRMEKHFDDRIKEVEDGVDERIAELNKGWEREFNAFTQANHARMNGFGDRVQRNENEVIALIAISKELAVAMAESRTDRVHLNRELAGIRQMMEALREDRTVFERQVLGTLARIQKRDD